MLKMTKRFSRNTRNQLGHSNVSDDSQDPDDHKTHSRCHSVCAKTFTFENLNSVATITTALIDLFNGVYMGHNNNDIFITGTVLGIATGAYAKSANVYKSYQQLAVLQRDLLEAAIDMGEQNGFNFFCSSKMLNSKEAILSAFDKGKEINCISLANGGHQVKLKRAHSAEVAFSTLFPLIFLAAPPTAAFVHQYLNVQAPQGDDVHDLEAPMVDGYWRVTLPLIFSILSTTGASDYLANLPVRYLKAPYKTESILDEQIKDLGEQGLKLLEIITTQEGIEVPFSLIKFLILHTKINIGKCRDAFRAIVKKQQEQDSSIIITVDENRTEARDQEIVDDLELSVADLFQSLNATAQSTDRKVSALLDAIPSTQQLNDAKAKVELLGREVTMFKDGADELREELEEAQENYKELELRNRALSADHRDLVSQIIELKNTSHNQSETIRELEGTVEEYRELVGQTREVHQVQVANFQMILEQGYKLLDAKQEELNNLMHELVELRREKEARESEHHMEQGIKEAQSTNKGSMLTNLMRRKTATNKSKDGAQGVLDLQLAKQKYR